ncbi:hypothetical protein EDB83DRAFT_2512453 [Lactarius deliciosus]|nr:hypothetical protein EDB83DRAFT_2512453 [Lactarius deliciosus]
MSSSLPTYPFGLVPPLFMPTSATTHRISYQNHHSQDPIRCPLPAHINHCRPYPLPVRSKSLKLFKSKAPAAHVKPELAVEGPDPRRPIIRRNRSLTADARNSAHRHFKIFSDEFSASEETLVEPEVIDTFPPPGHTVPSEDGLSLRTGGLYIQFPTSSPTNSEDPSGAPSLPTMESDTAGTLQAAGMEAPPKPTKKFDAEVSAGANNEDARLVKGSQGLFKGTYGQVRAAFRAAGLVTTPCREDGVPDATRLGALFIANPDGRGAIVFTKVVMWG